MIPKEVFKKVRRIQITTSRMVTDMFAGQYHSVFKGKGMEFDEVRQYQPGDDIRSIDWNVTARTGHPHVKRFTEERELTVMILMDISPSTGFGTVGNLKSELAAELCSVLALSAIENNDKVGFISFTDQIEKFVPARKGLRHTLSIVREALYSQPKGAGTNISGAIEHLNRVTKRRAVTFIISDFYDDNFKRDLAVANKRHDIVAIGITDPAELEMPQGNLIEFYDPETKQEFLVDTSDSGLLKKYQKHANELFEQRQKLFRSIGVDFLDIRTDSPYDQVLSNFFRNRQKRH